MLLPNSRCVKNRVCAILTSLKQSLSLALASFLLVLNYTTQFQSLSITIEHYLSVREIAIISAFRYKPRTITGGHISLNEAVGWSCKTRTVHITLSRCSAAMVVVCSDMKVVACR